MKLVMICRITAVFVSLFLITGCGNKEQYIGKYTFIDNHNSQNTIELDLKSDGQGSWASSTDNISFRWEVRAGKLWLHTKTGGVITGEFGDETIRIHLPGAGDYLFQKNRS